MKNLYKYLVYYYGILQLVHLIVNFMVIFIPSFNATGLLSGSLDKNEFQFLLTSSFLDFFLASPLGLIFVFGFIKNKKWADAVGIGSLSVALVSAFIYTYLLITFNAWELTPANIIINLLFIPPLILYFLLLKKNIK